MEVNLNILVRIRGQDRYIWVFTDDHAVDVLRSAGRFAINESLNFTWWDVAVISQEVRRMVCRSGTARRE